MKGVISHYAMQQFAMRGKPPFQIPTGVKNKAHSVQALSQDGVCQRCRCIFQILLDAIDGNNELETYPHQENLGKLAMSAMIEAKRCPICSLFLETVLADLEDPLPEMYQKRSTNISFVEEKMDSSISPVANAVVRFTYSGPNDALSGRYFQIDLGSDWTTRLPARATANKAPLNLARNWLTMCAGSHTTCPRMKDQELPTRLIDVGPLDREPQPRLVHTGQDGHPSRGRYLALSHCWGTPNPEVVTKIRNLQYHLEHIPIASLAKNFQDAILVTRELGYRYVWIDSLCIIQDSAKDWEHECIRMEAVYANAAITIAAVGAVCSTEGFLNTRPEQKSCEVNLQHRDGDLVKMRISRMSTGQACVFKQENAALDSRAWAMQERLLSSRILSFGSEQMYFECCTAEFFESSRFPIQPRSSERSSWLSNPKAMQKPPSTLDFYHTVGAYTYRFLTKGSDKLPAIGGIARRFQSLTRDQYVVGLWRSDILQGLSWKAGWHDGSENGKAPRYQRDSKADQVSAPSWSWASCEMPIKFENIQRDRPLVEILKCEARTVGKDGFGQVSGGELEIVGWTIECTANEGNYQPHWWGEDLRADVCGKKDRLVARLFRDRPPLPSHALEDLKSVIYPDVSTVPDSSAPNTDTEPMELSRTEFQETLHDTQDTELVTGYLLTGDSQINEQADMAPPLSRLELQQSSNTLYITCLVISKGLPSKTTPDRDWCGLALIPAVEHDAITFRRVGYIRSSQMYTKYGKLDVSPEESLDDIQWRDKQTIRIV